MMEIRIEPGDKDLLSGLPSLRAIWLGERRLAVVEILDRWAGTEDDFVKIRAEDGATYILRRDLRCGLWELAAYRGPEASASAAGKQSG